MKLADTQPCSVCRRPVSIGLLVEGNAYFSDFERYWQMEIGQLREEKESILAMRRAAYRAFISHRTVPWFGGSILVSACLATIGFWWPQFVSPWSGGATAIAGVACFPLLLWMNNERGPLQDGLRMLRDRLRLVKACLAIREIGGASRKSEPRPLAATSPTQPKNWHSKPGGR